MDAQYQTFKPHDLVTVDDRKTNIYRGIVVSTETHNGTEYVLIGKDDNGKTKPVKYINDPVVGPIITKVCGRTMLQQLQRSFE